MDLLKLENQLCFPVYALSRQITALYRPLLETLDLTYPQYLVMLLLWENSSVPIKHLGERLLLDTGTLTPLLKRMQQKGLINRRRSEIDERVVTISLTAAGVAMQEAAVRIPNELLCEMGASTDLVVRLRTDVNSLLHFIQNKPENYGN